MVSVRCLCAMVLVLLLVWWWVSLDGPGGRVWVRWLISSWLCRVVSILRKSYLAP